MQEIWFPASEKDSKVTGRFADTDEEYTNKDGIKITRTITRLFSKIPGSNDVAAQRVKPFNQAELTKRFPEAWAHYERLKAAAASAPPPVPIATEFGIKGTPIEELTFINKDRLAMLVGMGFTTAEQIRDMSDSICDRVGTGSRQMRKKANEYLIAKAG